MIVVDKKAEPGDLVFEDLHDGGEGGAEDQDLWLSNGGEVHGDAGADGFAKDHDIIVSNLKLI